MGAARAGDDLERIDAVRGVLTTMASWPLTNAQRAYVSTRTAELDAEQAALAAIPLEMTR